jgi:cytoskeletal protein RodZ
MKRASFLLQSARLDKEYTIEEISQKTKIPIRFLQAFEQEIPKNFPNEPYCSLMLREYSTYLSLNPDEVVSIFRRDYANKIKNNDIKKSFFAFTPQFTYTFFTAILVLLFSGYIFFEYVKYNRPPNLTVDWPKNYSKIVEISGKTDAESTVKINQDLVVVNQEGVFFKKMELSTGEAKITVESVSPAGKSTIEEKILK